MQPHLRSFALAALAAAAPSQDRLPTHRVSNNLPAPFASGGYGDNLIDLGDFDGDGFADYAVSAPGAAEPLGGPNTFGVVYVQSGRRGTVITTMVGDQNSSAFGEAMVSVGDVDGDGTPDLAVSAPNHDSGGWTNDGRITMFSGADGSVLWTADGDGQTLTLGTCLAATPDLTGDGIPDLVGGEPGYGVGLLGRGRIRFLNGATGATFGFAAGPIALSSFGATAAGSAASMAVYVGDAVGRIYTVPAPTLGMATPVLFQDKPAGNHVAAQLALVARPGSGLRLIVGRPTLDLAGNNSGAVELLELGGQRVFQRLGATAIASMGARVGRGQDLDGDGQQEVLVGSSGGSFLTPAIVEVLRQDGTVQDVLTSRCSQIPILASLPDTTGDGRGQLLAATASGQCGMAEAWLFAGGLAVASQAPTPSGAFRAAFDIDLGPALAGVDYWQLYSLSGTVPGFLGPVPWPLVPLNLDDTTTAMDQLAGSPFTPDSKGALSGLGTASTRLFIPPAIAGFLSGATISSTVVALDNSAFAVLATSNPVEIILP